MSRISQCDDSRSQYLIWPSLDSNIKNIPAILEKAPQHKLSLNSLKTNLITFASVPSSSASPSPVSPRSFASPNYKNTRYWKEHLQISQSPEKNLHILEDSLVARVGEDNLSNSTSYESQIKPSTQSTVGPVSIKGDFDFGLSCSEPRALTSPDHMARTTPRSFSNESVLSYFTENHLSKASQDVNFSTEITNLVSTVGSAEVVIAYLLKEKKAQAAQNSQLWRLVDKQRGMILGLNKDLERVLRDKDRYRKKFRELAAKTSTTDSANSNEKLNSNDENETDVAENYSNDISENANSVEVRISDESVPESPTDLVVATYPMIPKFEDFSHQGLADLGRLEFKIPFPSEQYLHLKSQSDLDHGYQDEAQSTDKIMTQMASIEKSSSSDSLTPKPSLKSPFPSMKEAVIEGPPEIRENRGINSQSRKASPAYLDLGNGSNSKFRSHSAQGISLLNEGQQDTSLHDNDTEKHNYEENGTKKEKKSLASLASGSEEEIISHNIKNIETESSLNSLCEKPVNATKRSSNSSDKKINASIVRTSPDLIPTPLRNSLFSTFRGSTGLPSSPRHMHVTATSTKTISNPKNTINSPPVSPTTNNSDESSFPLLSPTTSVHSNPPSSRSRPSTKLTKSTEDIKQETYDSTSPTISSNKQDKKAKHNKNNEKSESQNNLGASDDNIFRGFLSEEYPGLLLPPNALAKVNVKVASSRMKPSRASIMFPKNAEEDPVFTLALFSKSDQRELWRVEKDFISLSLLDQTLKECSNYNAKFPERSLFSGHAPAKVDARRQALNDYLGAILIIQNDVTAALEICKYLSLNALGAIAENFSSIDMPIKANALSLGKGSGGKPLKNGYLTKRGKNFGGWKARYFVLDGPMLYYFESPGGPRLGSIRLQSAQIGKQSQPNEKSISHGEGDESEGKYRHAFLILEPKRKESSSVIRHVLCAESDSERDQWVEALCQYINYKNKDEKDSSHEKHGQPITSSDNNKIKAKSQKNQASNGPNDSIFRGISYEDTQPKNKPILGPKNDNSEDFSPTESSIDQESLENSSQPQSPNGVSKQSFISQGQTGLSSSQSNSQSSLNEKISFEKIKHRKRSFFGFGTKTKIHTESSDLGSTIVSNNQLFNDQQNLAKNIFGASLSIAVKHSRPADADVEIPAVVYRCIEYLDTKNAFHEEGIFRLSGSNLVIKRLRERFNSEGDINLLLDDQYYDIHAVASLLKLYLRELPSTILTRQLHAEFLAVNDLSDPNERISALKKLVGRLPSENQALLKYLISFLIKIVGNSDVNKMTIRNVGIVFSPTLNIPSAILSLFIQQYSKIFGVEPDYRPIPASDSSSLNSSNEINGTQLPSVAKNREISKVASKLAGPTFIKSISASKSYRQNIPESLPAKVKRRDSNMFGMNVTGFNQRRGSFNK
ncbi:putative Rho-type GTPase-activating protein 2 [Erysiphe necator]|nr:putative Rho-type GTPase-activating protein 2 [Erysiphe necator]